MKLDLIKTHQHSQGSTKDSTLIVFSSSQKKGKSDVVRIHAGGLEKALQESLADKTITGKNQETILFRSLGYEGHKNILVCGLGERVDHETIRQLAPTVLGAIKNSKTSENCVLADGLASSKRDLAVFIQAFAEGLLLSDYDFNELKSKKKDEDKKVQHISLVSKAAAEVSVKKAFQEALILAEAVNFSRRLGDLPGNMMTPKILAETVVAKIKGTKIKAEIWDKARIKKEKMGGLYGVAQGSYEEPRLIVLRYNGAGAGKKPIVFVGKGLTFDSGGISIKPGAAMEEMKYDMCGGANVLGALIAMARLKLKVNAVAIVPASENMPGGGATKPGDVHAARNGKTFEVNNTDAEGRLILSDALCLGSEMKPQMMIDAATLTGAIVMALGNTHTGYFCKNEALTKKIVNAAEVSGEWIWRLPLTDFHLKDMKGTYADLSNISSSKGAGSATAAAFLEQFVEDGIPWAHFDIAGTAWGVGGRVPYCPKKGASGVMVRTFVELAKQYE